MKHEPKHLLPHDLEVFGGMTEMLRRSCCRFLLSDDPEVLSSSHGVQYVTLDEEHAKRLHDEWLWITSPEYLDPMPRLDGVKFQITLREQRTAIGTLYTVAVMLVPQVPGTSSR